MLAYQSLQPCTAPGIRSTARSTGRNRLVSAEHMPRKNHLLAALPLEDYERLLPDLELVPLPLNSTVYGAATRESHLYFLTDGLVSRFYITENGASAELAVTGNEGVIGVSAFLGGESSPSQVEVLSAGYAYRLKANPLQSELTHGGPLLPLLLRYTHALIAQTEQMAVCNRHHSLEQRLCRWILSCIDRLPSNEFKMTQERIANMLGVRRESVTEAVGKLQMAGLIQHSRGRITVLNRLRLEGRACECYAVVKREYDQMLKQHRLSDTNNIRHQQNQPARDTSAHLTSPLHFSST